LTTTKYILNDNTTLTNSGETLTFNTITDFTGEVLRNGVDINDLYAPIVHNHSINEVDGLEDALASKAEALHNHTITEVTGLNDALNSKAVATNTYSKAEVDNKITAVVTNIDWKGSVATLTALTTTYPSPETGWTVTVNDTSIDYRWDGNEWVNIGNNSVPLATQSLDGRMSKEDKLKLDTQMVKSVNNITPDASGNITLNITPEVKKYATTIESYTQNMNITHNLNDSDIILQAYKNNDSTPLNYQIVNENTIKLTATGVETTAVVSGSGTEVETYTQDVWLDGYNRMGANIYHTFTDSQYVGVKINHKATGDILPSSSYKIVLNQYTDTFDIQLEQGIANFGYDEYTVTVFKLSNAHQFSNDGDYFVVSSSDDAYNELRIMASYDIVAGWYAVTLDRWGMGWSHYAYLDPDMPPCVIRHNLGSEYYDFIVSVHDVEEVMYQGTGGGVSTTTNSLDGIRLVIIK
jgi:hypothetical protein